MRYATGLSLLMLAIATNAGAQDTRSTSETKVKSDNGKVVMMVGCVMIGGGTNFTLANITTEREQGGTSAAARAGGPYALLPREGLDLGPFINQRVRMAGVVVPPAAKGDRDDKIEIEETTKIDVPNGRDRTTSSAKTVKVERGPMHQFLVAAVEMVAPSCEQ